MVLQGTPFRALIRRDALLERYRFRRTAIDWARGMKEPMHYKA